MGRLGFVGDSSFFNLDIVPWLDTYIQQKVVGLFLATIWWRSVGAIAIFLRVIRGL